MTELERIFHTSGLTICGSVIVLVIGQILIRFFIDPIIELREMIGKVADTVIFYANIYANPGVGSKEECHEAMDALRQSASLLRARAMAIPLNSLFAFLRVIPTPKSISEASGKLIGLSNSIHIGDPAENLKLQVSIRHALGLPEV